jgi:hypothetical protein
MKKTFNEVRYWILNYLEMMHWTVKRDLKVPHATSPNGEVRLWFKTQAIYMNDPGSDPRNFANTHSISSDMREYADDASKLLKSVQWHLDYAKTHDMR